MHVHTMLLNTCAQMIRYGKVFHPLPGVCLLGDNMHLQKYQDKEGAYTKYVVLSSDSENA